MRLSAVRCSADYFEWMCVCTVDWIRSWLSVPQRRDLRSEACVNRCEPTKRAVKNCVRP